MTQSGQSTASAVGLGDGLGSRGLSRQSVRLAVGTNRAVSYPAGSRWPRDAGQSGTVSADTQTVSSNY